MVPEDIKTLLFSNMIPERTGLFEKKL